MKTLKPITIPQIHSTQASIDARALKICGILPPPVNNVIKVYTKIVSCQDRRLNNITVRRIHKVTVHCFLSLIVVQAQALHSAMSNQVFSIRQCVHSVV